MLRRWQNSNTVIKLDPGHAGALYLRGAGAGAYGAREEGRTQLAAATKMLNEQRAARHKELKGGPGAESGISARTGAAWTTANEPSTPTEFLLDRQSNDWSPTWVSITLSAVAE